MGVGGVEIGKMLTSAKARIYDVKFIIRPIQKQEKAIIQTVPRSFPTNIKKFIYETLNYTANKKESTCKIRRCTKNR